ncbi:MAG: PQQ-binding-like beta-propeller repeat protein, partial [Flavobacteriales bacterium]|nr:PQQ-binding-like beta-propeller repeat protein [Flavobacteriales bacterium]
MTRSLTLLLFGVLLGHYTYAQPTPLWTTETGSVNWLRSTAVGALVACTANGLHGIDTKTGSIAWTIPALANAPESGYEEVVRSPFIAVVPAQHPEDLFIVEPFSGAVVFNSEEAGISNIASRYFLYANNVIVIVGQKADKTATMACVDMGTGKVLWTKDDSFSKLTACNSAGPNAMVLSTFFFVYKLDTRTGEEIWKKCPDPGFEKMAELATLLDKGGANLGLGDDVHGVFVTTSYAPELCFMGMQTSTRKERTDSQGKTTVEVVYNTFVNAFNIADGSYAWPKPLEMGQKLGTMVPLESGLLVGAGDRRSVDLLDYNSGAGLWGKNGKGVNVKGVLSGAVTIGDRVLLTSGGDDGVVSLVDATGEDLWKKPLKLDGAVRSVTLLGSDILIASEGEVEIVDLATGASLLEKTFQGGSRLVATGAELTYIFNTKDGLLYSVDTNGGPLRTVSTTELEFDGKEKATTLEYSPEGLIVASDQNLALIGVDGTKRYQKYFPAPRESGLTRALKYASAVRAAYYTAAYGYTSAAFGAASQNIEVQDANSRMAKEITGAVSDVYAKGSSVAASATKRFVQEANARF